MKIKFLYVDKDGKVTLTRKELDEIMKECYDNGYEDAKAIYSSSISILSSTPYYDYNRYGDSITCESTVTNVTGKVATCDSNCSNSVGNSVESALSNPAKLASVCEAFSTETVIG